MLGRPAGNSHSRPFIDSYIFDGPARVTFTCSFFPNPSHSKCLPFYARPPSSKAEYRIHDPGIKPIDLPPHSISSMTVLTIH
jgi:hypothetical protein